MIPHWHTGWGTRPLWTPKGHKQTCSVPEWSQSMEGQSEAPRWSGPARCTPSPPQPGGGLRVGAICLSVVFSIQINKSSLSSF